MKCRKLTGFAFWPSFIGFVMFQCIFSGCEFFIGEELLSENCNQVKNSYVISQQMKPHFHPYPISIRKDKKLEYKVLINEKMYILKYNRKHFQKDQEENFHKAHYIFARYFRQHFNLLFHTHTFSYIVRHIIRNQVNTQ